MKKNIVSGVLLVGTIILAGCEQQQVSQNQSTNKVNTAQKNEATAASQRLQPSADLGSWNTYKNEKYNFTIKYPNGWVADDDKSLAGPGFRPAGLSMQDIQAGKFDATKDCFFTVAFLAVSQDKTVPCKNNSGEITLGSNKFTKCNLAGIRYVLLHPKTGNVISFEYLDNPSCKSLSEKYLGSLQFN